LRVARKRADQETRRPEGEAEGHPPSATHDRIPGQPYGRSSLALLTDYLIAKAYRGSRPAGTEIVAATGSAAEALPDDDRYALSRVSVGLGSSAAGSTNSKSAHQVRDSIVGGSNLRPPSKVLPGLITTESAMPRASPR
jgi:hypothetical protein